MKNYVCILLKTMVCILLIVSLCGCWNSRELDTLGIVMGVGVDKADGSGNIKVTTQVVKPGEMKSTKKDSGGGEGNAYWNVGNTGETIFDTLRGITTKSSRKLFFPHNQVIIFSKDIAEKGLQKHVDFFNRDPETRLNVWVLISKGRADEVLKVKSELEKVPANNIAKIIDTEAAATSQILAVRLRELAPRFLSKTTAPIIPLIEISKDGDETTAVVSETAVFKEDKMIGTMDKHEGRGVLWVLGKVKSGIINVEGPENSIVSMETIRANGKIVPEIQNKKVIIKLNIFEEGNIGEQTGPENLSKLPVVAELERKKAELIKSEVMAAVQKAKEFDADVFGFGDAVHQKYPSDWKEMEGEWDKIFPDIEVKVNVKAKLRLMGRIIIPVVPPTEQEKK